MASWSDGKRRRRATRAPFDLGEGPFTVDVAVRRDAEDLHRELGRWGLDARVGPGPDGRVIVDAEDDLRESVLLELIVAVDAWLAMRPDDVARICAGSRTYAFSGAAAARRSPGERSPAA